MDPTDVPDDGLDPADVPGPATGLGTHPDSPRILAHLLVTLPSAGNTHAAEILLTMRADAWERGVEDPLMDLGERLAAEAGRTTVYTTTAHATEPPVGPSTVTATTGSGRVAADDAGVRFVVARGYAFEQFERYSVLKFADTDAAAGTAPHEPTAGPTRPLPPHIVALAESARAKAGPDYVLHTWAGTMPQTWVDQVAVLFTRMSTDTPSGGLDLGEDPWDGQRVRVWERERSDYGMTPLVTVVEHVPTGVLAGFTILSCPVDRPEFVWQEDTLVLREHRGHSLGMLVKTANLRALVDARPATGRVHTGNAGENSHMLAINVGLGFRPAGGWGMWQRRLTP